MPAKNDSRVVGSSGKKGNAKWVVLGAIFLAVVVGVQTGWVGFGWAQLKSALMPSDEGLLEYVPDDAGAVVLVDPHQIEPGALGSETGAVRQWMVRTREEMKKATGVDLLFDVDKLAAAPGLVVVRGRFSRGDLEKRLGEMAYREREHDGTRILVRDGDDAVCIVSGSLLLYGSEGSIGESLDAEKTGKNLAKKEGVVARLKAVGFNHPVLATLTLGEARPSVRDILMGSGGPRAVTVGVKTLAGLDLDVAVESQSPASAEELKKLLEEKRADAGALKGMLGGEAGDAILDALKKAELKTVESQVLAHAHLSQTQLDAVVKALEQAGPSADVYKNIRLMQLLIPGL